MIVYKIALSPAAMVAMGICVVTWSIWLEPVARLERMVVSLLGEH
jgi:hypothetical protein